MKHNLKYIVSIVLLLFAKQTLFAQTATVTPDSKIEIVIGVIVIIFILVVLYLLRVEKKVNALEKKIKEGQP
ncbi:MAG: hypothetical protein LC109_04065 [Bacteroidia bacterium]|jgi:uncharacterized membrane protein (DUF485 family)|nr:hypothetical protein [Bacteroidia bacterium]MCO5254655.1 hypothetical protein [Bacteroidota bacterium]MCZ2129424.1 hypothetical protein [Bacteroidia bacterium]